jgi:hypothetical protein
MVSDRLAQIEKNLNRLYRLLGAAEDGAIGAISKVDKLKYEMETEDLRPQISKTLEELFLLLNQESSGLTFVETDAQTGIDIIEQEIERLKQKQNLSEQVLGALQRIENHLNQPEATADAKLKGTLSMFPPFIGLSYESQLDTENFFRRYFPTFMGLIKGAKKP